MRGVLGGRRLLEGGCLVLDYVKVEMESKEGRESASDR